MKQLLGYDVTIFDGPRVAASTLRQSNPEIVASLGKKTGGIVLFGKGAGEGAMHFVDVPAFVSLVSPAAIAEGGVFVTITAPFAPAVKDFRSYQHLYLAIMLLTHLLALVIAWSINNTIKRSTAIITSSLGAAAKGNLQVNIRSARRAAVLHDSRVDQPHDLRDPAAHAAVPARREEAGDRRSRRRRGCPVTKRPGLQAADQSGARADDRGRITSSGFADDGRASTGARSPAEPARPAPPRPRSRASEPAPGRTGPTRTRRR